MMSKFGFLNSNYQKTSILPLSTDFPSQALQFYLLSEFWKKLPN
jgi:hypothetical protein